MSPFAATLRRSVAAQSSTVPCTTPLTRKARPKKSVAAQLPPEKLRALITLYHQSDSFINEDNLLEKINEALIQKRSQAYLQPYKEVTMESLQDAVKHRRANPKSIQIHSGGDGIETGEWSFVRGVRHREVAGAMYGLDGFSSTKKPKPGLELVQDVTKASPAKTS